MILLSVINGKEYFLNDEMDFDNPQTHYDQICSALEKQKKAHLIYPVQDVECLVFDAFGDGFAWWDEEKILFNGEHGPDVQKLDWGQGIEYSVKDSELFFMNSSAYGSNPELLEEKTGTRRSLLIKEYTTWKKQMGRISGSSDFERLSRCLR